MMSIFHRKRVHILTDHSKEGDAREQRAPCDRAHRELDRVDGPGSGTQDEQLDVVQHERDDLEEARCRSRQPLKNHIATDTSVKPPTVYT